VGKSLPRNPYLRWLIVIYAAVWIALAIAPHDREAWALENMLVVVLVGVLALTHRRLVFSNLSYTLIFVFLLFHVVGSHYTYSAVPVGDWARDTFGLRRNHYDRFVHFAFGVLMTYPLREITLRRVHPYRAWSYVIPVLAVLSLSSLYEILEALAAMLTDPELGIAFVGAQGDVWDHQMDMALAFTGAVLSMSISAAFHRRWGREPYLGPPG
jgi:putative membrane protein